MDDKYDLAKGDLYLFIDEKEESGLAQRYMKAHDFDPKIAFSEEGRIPDLDTLCHSISPIFANSLSNPQIPTLVIDHTYIELCLATSPSKELNLS